MATLAAIKTPLYLKLAQTLEQQIARGILRPGDRVPSVRSFSRQQGVSISTVIEAYVWLENRGAIESRPKSGFFVRVPFAKSVPEPRFQTPQPRPASFSAGGIVTEVLRSAHNPGIVPMGSALPDPELLPNGRLNQIARSVLRRFPLHSATYSFPPGAEPLRRQIARRSLTYGCSFSPSEIVEIDGQGRVNLSHKATLPGFEDMTIPSRGERRPPSNGSHPLARAGNRVGFGFTLTPMSSTRP